MADPVPSSALILGRSDEVGYDSHATVQYLRSLAVTYGTLIQDVDPLVFAQWCNNIWEMEVYERQLFTYKNQPVPIPSEDYSDRRIWYRTGPDGSRWDQIYPPPQTFFQPSENAYELNFPVYLYEDAPPPVDIIAQYPDVRFFTSDKKLMCSALPALYADLVSVSLSEDSITIRSEREIDYGVGTRLFECTQTATITKRFYT